MSSNNSDSPTDSLTAAGSLSRRSLLVRGAGFAAVGLVPGVLAACGGGDSSTAGTGTGATTTGAPQGEVGGTINYIGFQGEDYKEALKQFNQQNGITWKSSYITNGTVIPAKFAGGAGGYDIVNFTTAELPFVLSSGVDLQPIDTEQIPNYKLVEPFIDMVGAGNRFSNEAGELVALPIAWGALGISYDSAQIKEPTAWEQLLEPDFKGKLTVIDDPGPNYALVAKLLGFESSEMTQDQLEEANEYLKRVLENCRTLAPGWGDVANLLGTGEVQAAFGSWSAVDAFAAEAGSKSIRTNIDVEEGSIAFAEGYCLAPDAENVATVYAIMNQLLDPKTNAEAVSSIFCSSVVSGGAALQPKEVAALYPTEDEFEKYFSNNEIVKNPPVDGEFVTFPDLTEAWTQIKSEVA